MINGKIGFALVGAGAAAEMSAECIKRLPGSELVSLVDVDVLKARRMQIRFNSVRDYVRFEDCLQDDKVDIVIVCTPGSTHGNLTIQAARAGKHVLTEKPLDTDSGRMTKMIAACRDSGVKLGCLLQRRAWDESLRIKAMMETRALGDIVMADAYLKYYRDEGYYAEAPWRGSKANGGGALMNLGVHGIDLIQWLNGGVVSVSAKTSTRSRNIDAEDIAVAVVEFGNGAFGVIEASTLVYPNQGTQFELHGTGGTIRFDDDGITNCDFLSAISGIPFEAIAVDPLPEIEKGLIGHYRLIRDMASAVQEDRAPFITGEEARKSVDIIAAIRESSSSGREVKVEQIAARE